MPDLLTAFDWSQFRWHNPWPQASTYEICAVSFRPGHQRFTAGGTGRFRRPFSSGIVAFARAFSHIPSVGPVMRMHLLGRSSRSIAQSLSWEQPWRFFSVGDFRSPYVRLEGPLLLHMGLHPALPATSSPDKLGDYMNIFGHSVRRSSRHLQPQPACVSNQQL